MSAGSEIGGYLPLLFYEPISTAPAVEPAMMERNALGLEQSYQ